MNNIASFDIGEKNFAYCIGTRTNKIESIHLINLKLSGSQTVLESCNIVSEILSTINCDVFIIEQQVLQNIKSVRIAQHMWTWLTIHGKTVYFIHAKKKNLNCRCDTWYKRKKCSVANVLKMVPADIAAEINRLEKRDDVCDCILQMFSFNDPTTQFVCFSNL